MRYNATFRYNPVQNSGSHDNEGFYDPGSSAPDWIDGIECYVEKHIPAKQVMGIDGQIFTYNYTIYIPKWFDQCKLEVTGTLEITYNESVGRETITIKGVDDINRKNIEIWA